MAFRWARSCTFMETHPLQSKVGEYKLTLETLKAREHCAISYAHQLPSHPMPGLIKSGSFTALNLCTVFAVRSPRNTQSSSTICFVTCQLVAVDSGSPETFHFGLSQQEINHFIISDGFLGSLKFKKKHSPFDSCKLRGAGSNGTKTPRINLIESKKPMKSISTRRFQRRSCTRRSYDGTCSWAFQKPRKNKNIP